MLSLAGGGCGRVATGRPGGPGRSSIGVDGLGRELFKDGGCGPALSMNARHRQGPDS